MSPGRERNIEVEVLDSVEIRDQAMDGIIEDEGDEREASANDQSPEKRRWVRLARAGLRMARDVRGFEFVAAALEDGRPCRRVEGARAEGHTVACGGAAPAGDEEGRRLDGG